MLDLTILMVEDLQSRGWTLATAESCTAGRIAQTFADAKGSGEVYVGGVIAYRKDRKATVLGVPEDLLRQPEGAVSEAVAVGMAEGVRHLMGSTSRSPQRGSRVPRLTRTATPSAGSTLPSPAMALRPTAAASISARWTLTRSLPAPSMPPC